MWDALDCGVHSHNSKPFPRYRVPQRVTTRVRAHRAPLREPSDTAWDGRRRSTCGLSTWWKHA
eukprot:1797210-Prymnesium_polylepis.1